MLRFLCVVFLLLAHGKFVDALYWKKFRLKTVGYFNVNYRAVLPGKIFSWPTWLSSLILNKTHFVARKLFLSLTRVDFAVSSRPYMYMFFPPCHFDAYSPRKGPQVFSSWFSKEITRGAVRVIWQRHALLVYPPLSELRSTKQPSQNVRKISEEIADYFVFLSYPRNSSHHSCINSNCKTLYLWYGKGSMSFIKLYCWDTASQVWLSFSLIF